MSFQVLVFRVFLGRLGSFYASFLSNLWEKGYLRLFFTSICASQCGKRGFQIFYSASLSPDSVLGPSNHLERKNGCFSYEYVNLKVS